MPGRGVAVLLLLPMVACSMPPSAVESEPPAPEAATPSPPAEALASEPEAPPERIVAAIRCGRPAVVEVGEGLTPVELTTTSRFHGSRSTTGYRPASGGWVCVTGSFRATEVPPEPVFGVEGIRLEWEPERYADPAVEGTGIVLPGFFFVTRPAWAESIHERVEGLYASRDDPQALAAACGELSGLKPEFDPSDLDPAIEGWLGSGGQAVFDARPLSLKLSRDLESFEALCE